MNILLILSSVTSEGGEGSGGNSNATESLKKIFTSPILYIVLGAIVLLLVLFYLIRRFVKAQPHATTIIVRKGKVYKVLNERNPKAFLVPFRDSVGAIIKEDEKEFSSDKLFINNGPDALYKINYTLKYKVLDPVAFYPYIGKLENELPIKLNDELRLFADNGNALILIKDYRKKASDILAVINKAVEEYHIEVTSFKINIIEPMGRN